MALTTYVSGACIRLDADGPYLHVNETHSAPYVDRVCIEENFLTIYHRAPASGAACSSVVVSPDETLAGAKGIIGGASGGTGRTRIRLYSTQLGRRLYLGGKDYDLVAGPTSNIWVQWVHTSDA